MVLTHIDPHRLTAVQVGPMDLNVDTLGFLPARFLSQARVTNVGYSLHSPSSPTRFNAAATAFSCASSVASILPSPLCSLPAL